MRTPMAAGRRATRCPHWPRRERALPNPGQSNRISCDAVVAQDHEDTLGNLAFDESASAGQRTPVESLVERSIHGIAESIPTSAVWRMCCAARRMSLLA
jgi:hypothetical protein